MSFSSEVKRELASVEPGSRDGKYAELYGMALFSGRFSNREIVFKTENRYSASRFERLLSELFNPIIEKKSDLKLNTDSRGLYRISVLMSEDCKRIFEDFGHSPRDIKLRINRANIADESLYASFLRGVFLSCGSVTDPDKGYHLELNVQRRALAENLVHLIGEIEVFSSKPKLSLRNGSSVIYYKDNDGICEFLGYIGAGNAVMKLLAASAYKETMNLLNRRMNSELANIKKTSDASARQIHAIKKIIKRDGIESLPAELRELAALRLDNPDMSLKELGESFDPPISRSGVNHRLQKLLKLAETSDKECPKN